MIWDLDKQCDVCQMNPLLIFTYESTFQYSQYLFPLLASLFLQFEKTHIYNILFWFFLQEKETFISSQLKAKGLTMRDEQGDDTHPYPHEMQS